MGRLPFDPSKMRAKEQAAAAGAPAGDAPAGSAQTRGVQPLTVSQLAASVDAALRAGVPRSVRVIGEISNFTNRTHWYFAIKDAEAVVSCVMFQFATRRAGFVPESGQEVVVTGNVEFYAPQGRLTLRVESIEPVGAGALEIAYRKLVEELRGLGWFASERKRELPAMPRRIAVITSRTGAALQDVLDTARRRAPFVEVCLIDTLVQGAAAAPEIARAISWVSANAARLEIDTLIVTRGGGSAEDLWAFNDRAVAEAILNCSIPVAAAIGHETDTTIAELVADVRCATPTQAAMRATPDAAALREQLESLRQRLSAGLRLGARRAAQVLQSARRELTATLSTRVQAAGRATERLAMRLESQRPSAVYQRRRSTVDRISGALQAAMTQRLRAVDLAPRRARLDRAVVVLARLRKERLEATARALELVGPAAVLARGFSITLGPDGMPIRSAGAVKPGDRLQTKLAEGTVKSVVEGLEDVHRRHGESTSGAAAPARRKPRAKDDPGQPGLFGGAG